MSAVVNLTLRRLAKELHHVLVAGEVVGIKAALHREVIRRTLELEVGQPVRDPVMRQAKELLWETGTVVCSCQRGYFLPATQDEAVKYGLMVYVKLNADSSHKIRCGQRAIARQFHPERKKGVHGVQQVLFDERLEAPL